MKKKIGRNDTCPCGSGKKYKNCCLKKQYEQSAAKYTPSGKRKFKARLLVSHEKTDFSFDHAVSQSHFSVHDENLNQTEFSITQENFQKQTEEQPIKFEETQKMPQVHERHLPTAEEPFQPTHEDFRIGK